MPKKFHETTLISWEIMLHCVLYYITFQICMVNLDDTTSGGTLQVGTFTKLTSITVDPIHGYRNILTVCVLDVFMCFSLCPRFFYLMTSDQNVHLLNLSTTQQASTDLSSTSSLFLSEGIAAFTLDLAESQYFYANKTDRYRFFRNQLGGENLRDSESLPNSNLLPTLAPFAGSLLSYSSSLNDFIGISFTSRELNMLAIPDVRAMTLLRSVSQPLPSE